MKKLLFLFGIVCVSGIAQLVPPVSIQDPVTHQWVNVVNGGIGVAGVGNATGSTGQQTATTSAVALATFAAKQVCINALSTNTISVFIGFSGAVTTGTGFELTAKSGVCLPVSNSSLIFIIASSGSGGTVTWIATN